MCHSGTWHILHVLGSSHFQEFSCRQMAGHHAEHLSHQSAAVLTSCLTKHALFFSHQCQLMVPAGSRVEYAILSLQVATSEPETCTEWAVGLAQASQVHVRDDASERTDAGAVLASGTHPGICSIRNSTITQFKTACSFVYGDKGNDCADHCSGPFEIPSAAICLGYEFLCH